MKSILSSVVMVSAITVSLTGCDVQFADGLERSSSTSPVDYEVLYQGENALASTSTKSAFRKVLTSASQLNDAMTHYTYPLLTDTPDFSEGNVLWVNWGEMPNGGYNVQVRDVQENANGIVVSLDYVSPGADCMTTQAFTYPHLFVYVSSKQDISVNGRYVDEDCSTQDLGQLPPEKNDDEEVVPVEETVPVKENSDDVVTALEVRELWSSYTSMHHDEHIQQIRWVHSRSDLLEIKVDYPGIELPDDIDWDNGQVVVLDYGIRPSSGYSVEVMGAQASSEQASLVVQWQQTNTECNDVFHLSELTRPVLWVYVPTKLDLAITETTIAPPCAS